MQSTAGPVADPRLCVLNVTPDPGVIEVNIHPAADWDSLCANTFALYELEIAFQQMAAKQVAGEESATP